MLTTTAAAIVACILFVSPAMAARGIVTKKPGSGNPQGRIVVTSVDAGATHTAGIGDEIDSGEDTCASGLGIGDVVSFDIAPDSTGAGEVAVNLQLLSSGSVLAGPWRRHLVIEAGESVLVTGSVMLEGKVTVNGGTLIILENASIEGKIDAANGAVVIVGQGVDVGGKIDSDDAAALVLDGTTVDGKISSHGNSFVSITGCTIQGKLDVINATTCRISDNVVTGGTNTPGCN